MSENASNKNVSNDEIDLLELFRRMGNTLSKWINALGRAFLISIVFLLRRWLPLGLSVFAGIGLSYFMKYTTESTFSTDMQLRLNTGSSVADMISYINRLHVYCEEDNLDALSQEMDVKADKLTNIIDIGAFWIIDNKRDGIPDFVDYDGKHNIYDTLNVRMLNRFDIRVKIKSTQELSTIKSALLNYINSDSLLQQRNLVRLKHNREILGRLEYDILQLDSLQKVKYFEETRNMEPQKGGQMIFLQEQKTQLLYQDIYSLYSRKQDIETELDLYPDVVTVLSDFSQPSLRENSGLYYAKKYVPFFFIITLLVLILLSNQNKLKQLFIKY